ncbi:protein ROS1A-like isoform X2 [Oryza brachyantha]|uniref:protein ROS1A-like isoform X2 n=1 Tax=Oryza brachyantha TaxID=4533 RepID=UPI0003EA868A|nr:protein ROS1A-like isoform X2 [Oryza brachyantha]
MAGIAGEGNMEVNPSIETGIRNVTPVPSEKVSTNLQAVRSDGGLAEGTDRTRKTVQKPKRKKHRPKVIKEGKAAKAQKSTTGEPSTEKGNKPAGKRKYVRRKGLNTPTEQLPSEFADAHTIDVPSPARRCLNFDREDQDENVDLVSQTQVKEIPTCHGGAQSLTSAVERSHIQVVQPWSGISSSISASVDPMANMQQLWADSRPNRATFDLNNSVANHIPSKFPNHTDSSGQNFQFGSREQLNQFQDFYNSIPDRSVYLKSSAKQMQSCSIDYDLYLFVPQSSTEELSRPDQMFCGYKILENPAVPARHTERVWKAGNFNHEVSMTVNPMPQGYKIPQSPIIPSTCSERNTMSRNLSKFPVKNDYLRFATNPNDQGAAFDLHNSRFSDVHAIGKKREFNAINGHQVSFGVNLEQSNSERQFYNDPLPTSSQTYLPETCKRMRSENHSNWLNGLAGKFSSSSAYLSGNWNINNVSAVNPGVCTLADVQRLMSHEKSKSSQQMIGSRTVVNNMVQQQADPTLQNTSNKYFIASSDKHFKDFTAQETELPDSAMNSRGENIVRTNGDHQLESLEIRPPRHYTSECFALPNELSGYTTAGHTQLRSATMNPSIKKNYFSSNGIHQPQSSENQSVIKGPDLFEPHNSFIQYGTDGTSCINIPAQKIDRTSAEVGSHFQSINQSTRTENCHLEASRETTSASPTEKPKARGRPRKDAEPGGKPRARGRPNKEAEPDGKPKPRGRPRKAADPDGKPKARGRPRKKAEANGKPEDINSTMIEHDGREKHSSTKGRHTDHASISCALEPSSGISPRLTPVEAERSGVIRSRILETYYHDKYNSLSSMQTHTGTIPEIIQPSLDYVEAIIEKLNLLSISMISDNIVEEASKNSLVPYEDKLGALVPFEGKSKKKHSRVKVNIDPVTNLMWNLLMAPDMCDGAEGMDDDKERFLEEERRVFRGRIDSFIARMHLVQGDRRFSPWKGSVVDSVVGVFLTQNVSDHLSSSAFMALAAKFPVKSEGPENPAVEMSFAPPEQKDGCSGLFGESIKLQGNFFVEEIRDIRSLNTVEDNEGSNSNELIGTSSGNAINQVTRECPVSYMKSQTGSHENRTPGYTAPEIVSAGTVEVDDGSLEDVLSSQNSAVSPQNSPEYCLNRTYTMGSSSTVNSELPPIQDKQSIPNGKVGSSEYHEVSVLPTSDLNKGVLLDLNRIYQPAHTPYMQNSLFDFTDVSYGSHLDTSFGTGLDGVNISNVTQSEDGLCQHRTASVNKNKTKMTDSSNSFLYDRDGSLSQDMCSFPFEPSQEADCLPTIKQSFQQLISSEEVPISTGHSFYDNRFTSNKTGNSYIEQHDCLNLQEVYTARTSQMNSERFLPQCNWQDNDIIVQAKTCENLCGNKTPHSDVSQRVASVSIGKSKHSEKSPLEFSTDGSKTSKVRGRTKRKHFDWDNLRKEVLHNCGNRQRSDKVKDAIDWEAVRQADLREISEAIRERGMNNMLAERIKAFLNRLVSDHGSIDLEWLRDIEPDKAKDYLLSIRGLGLKSVECVRLLTLHHMAFPVDTNVARICVRLGWVPLQPLPESLQLHLLELYPMLEQIQKYIWPRLCKLDQLILYELHYQMITFGKVFCSKSRPNCNSCPMRAECKHFASAFASARLALPGPLERSLVVKPEDPNAAERCHKKYTDSRPIGQLSWNTNHPEHVCGDQQPIIEEPSTPEPEPENAETKEAEIEDFFGEDPDEIPTINLNVEEFAQNLKSYIRSNNIEIEDADMSMALVAITPQAASVPTSKLKNVNRLRTEHQVYELPDSHPLLEGFDQREPDDPCPYLLSIWTPGETAQSTDAPKTFCNSQETGKLCESLTCFSCNNLREMQSQKVRGTLLIPCRTAMRGSFPLNGTYFQVNEVFADHYSSQNPIDVPRSWIWNLPRRTVYFGTSVPTIFRGLNTEEIQHCFWRGFVCVRGFDRKSRAPRPLYARLHFPASKVARGKKPAAAREEEIGH